MRASLSAVGIQSNRSCSKCGVAKKAGRLSCCARGGAWFKSCGDAGDIQFDHTWAEGMQACKGFTSPNSVETPVRVMLNQAGIIDYPPYMSHSQNTTTEQQTNVHDLDNMQNDVGTDSEGSVAFPKVGVCVYILYVFEITGLYCEFAG